MEEKNVGFPKSEFKILQEKMILPPILVAPLSINNDNSLSYRTTHQD